MWETLAHLWSIVQGNAIWSLVVIAASAIPAWLKYRGSAPHWIARVNGCTQFQNLVHIYCERPVQSIPEVLIRGSICLQDDMEEKASEMRKSLKVNDAHALVRGPVDRCARSGLPIEVDSIDFAGLSILRKGPQVSDIYVLSACGVIVCPERRVIILHRRSGDSATFPNCLHTIGGAFMPGVPGRIGDPSLSFTLTREFMEEAQINVIGLARKSIVSVETSYADRNHAELRGKFLQFVYLGCVIRPEDADSIRRYAEKHSTHEGICTAISYDELPELLEDPSCDWVPSGRAHILAWLALGAPQGGRFDILRPRFGKERLSPFQLFERCVGK